MGEGLPPRASRRAQGGRGVELAIGKPFPQLAGSARQREPTPVGPREVKRPAMIDWLAWNKSGRVHYGQDAAWRLAAPPQLKHRVSGHNLLIGIAGLGVN